MAARRIAGGTWRVWASAIPLVAAVGLLQLFCVPQPLTREELGTLSTALGTAPDYMPGEVTYIAVALVHLLICAAAVVAALNLLRRTPGSRRFMRAGLWLGLVCLAAFPTAALLPHVAAADLSYGLFRTLLTPPGTEHHFVARPFGLSPLEAAILLPAAGGIFAVAFTAAAANAQLPLVGLVARTRGEARMARIVQLSERLKRCLYGLALILVTSTVLASIFFHLPANLKLPENSPDGPLLARLSDFAGELSIFWGAVYTVTLAVAVGLPTLMFQARVQRLLEPPFNTPLAVERRKQLAKSAVLTGSGEQLKLIAAILAPLATGPIASLVQGLAKL